MKNLIEIIKEENIEQRHLKPTFYYKCDDFFNVLTNIEQQKNIHATYKLIDNKRFIYFYNGKEQLGYLRLTHANAL
jgi:hypothetical protein